MPLPDYLRFERDARLWDREDIYDEKAHGAWMIESSKRAEPREKIREENAHADLDGLLLGYESVIGSLIGRVGRSLSGAISGEQFASCAKKIDLLRYVLQQESDIRAKLVYERCKEEMSLILVDENVALARAEVMAAQGEIGKVIAYAKAIALLKEQLRPHMRDIMALQGSPLGYSTDGKDYGEDIVSNVIVEGLLRGFAITNNEITIISGRFYGNKNGYERLVKNWPGLTCLEMMPTVPQLVGDKGALVGGYVAWRLHGCQFRIDFALTPEGDFRLPIRVNGGMGMDAILGKAKKKMLARVLERVSGIPSPEDDDSEILEGTATAADPQESLPAPTQGELSAGDHEYMQATRLDIERADTVAELTAIFKTLERRKPHLVEIAKSLCTARKLALEAKAAT